MSNSYAEKKYTYKVSVVTAVYNVQKYVAEMIESIIAQTIGIRNIQLILVDDGSTDDSGSICDSYARKYPNNIFVYHKRNGGVSSARNYGIDHVDGKYVNFCDADDKLKSDALEKMYAYIEEKSDIIDLVSIPLIFFGAKEGEHPLNYKFEKTGIIDLKERYDCIQLHTNSVLVKTEKIIKFDEQLSFAEDAKYINNILLEKMQYGVISDTCCYYRKREDGSSALDTGRNKKEYYIPYMERFIFDLIRKSQKQMDIVPKFVQYICLYDLNWRFGIYPCVQPGVINEDEKIKYIELIKEVLRYIETEVVLKSDILDCYKWAIVSLNEGKSTDEAAYKSLHDQITQAEDSTTGHLELYSVYFDFINFYENSIVLEGYVKSPLDTDKVQLYCTFDENITKNYAQLHVRKDKCDYFLDEVLIYSTQFEATIPFSTESIRNLTLYLEIKGQVLRLEKCYFNKFFPLSHKLNNSYFYKNGILFTWNTNGFEIKKKVHKIKALQKEIRLLAELASNKDVMVKRAAISRTIYHFMKLFKRKKIWIIGDRTTRADDNGEAFFKYMNECKKNYSIKIYFMLNKTSPDYVRVSRIGKVLDFNTNKYKIMTLLCDLFVSSQGDDWVFNRFYSMAYAYKDIMYSQKFVFLQHGIIKDDLSRWLNRYNKNISLFITSTLREYNSILEYDYGYSEKQVKLTGLPRYDSLYDDSNNRKNITVMPTWRAYLVNGFDAKTDSRALNSGFVDSTYCAMYRSLFTNERLKKSLRDNGYVLQLMFHPTMPRECMDYFKISEDIKILPSNTRYCDIFARSNLLITDYSSTVFDFAYLNKPVLYYQADKDEFFSGKHSYDKGYFDYERDGFGEVTYDVEYLVDLVIDYMEHGCKIKEKYRKKIANTFYYHDTNNCARVYEQIQNLLSED